MAPVARRNAPCPCGSGKKHKRCCLGKEVEPAARRRRYVPLVVALLGTGAGVWLTATRGLGLGIATGAGGLILAGLIAVIADPPPPGGRGKDPSGINFGS